MASSAWLVTTRSAARAASRDASTRQASPYGQRCGVRHSRTGIETCCQARSVCDGASSRSARPPAAACSSAHSRSASTSAPRTDSGLARGAALMVSARSSAEIRLAWSWALPVPHLEQTGVVGPTLEDRVPGPLADHRLDRVESGRDVGVGQLALQRQGGGGHHDPLARLLGQSDQRRGQVAEGLARAGARLHQQVPAGGQRRRRSRRPSPPGRAARSRRGRRPRTPARPGGLPANQTSPARRSPVHFSPESRRRLRCHEGVGGELAGQVGVDPGGQPGARRRCARWSSSSPDRWIRSIRSPRS